MEMTTNSLDEKPEYDLRLITNNTTDKAEFFLDFQSHLYKYNA